MTGKEPLPLPLTEPRVHFVFLRHGWRLATVEEYARAAGVDAAVVLQALSGPLSQGLISIETCDGTLFVHTAPRGRPVPPGMPSARPNLWETVRIRRSVAEAHRVWQLIRALETGGWTVVWDPETLVGLAPQAPPLLALKVHDTLVPLYDVGDRVEWVPDVCAATIGQAVAVTAGNHALDRTVTAVRAWMLRQRKLPQLAVLVLEPPMFAPTVVRGIDNSVTPVVVQRYEPGAIEL